MTIQCPTCLVDNPDDNLNCWACGSPLSISEADYHLSSGTIISSGKHQYRIEKTLGVGGFGITYKATNLSNSQTVAIKENWPENGSRQGQTIIWPASVLPHDRKAQIMKFIKEAKNIHACSEPYSHPHIVKVYESFSTNNTAYIVMEFLSGKSLYELLKEQGKLSETLVKKYFLQIADALKLLHNKELLHRDIKPDNILIIESEDRAVLIDFGNAREFIANKTQKMTQILTPGYAPLEQYATATTRGPTIDIYALCASMYELLTGQMPPNAMDRVSSSQDPLIPPRQLNPSISALMEQIVLTGMEIKAEDRYQTAEDLIDGLEGNPPGLRRARKLIKEKKLAEAVTVYESCLKQVEHGDAAVELALTLLYIDEQKAELAANQAMKLKPNDGRVFGVLGLIYCHKSQWQTALNHLQKAVKLCPNESWIQANLAWVLGESGLWKQAKTALNSALQLNPQCHFSLGLQAWIAINQQQWKPAIRYARPIIFKFKKSSEYQNLLSWLYPCLTVAIANAVVTQGAPDLVRCLQESMNYVPENGFAWGYQGWQQGKEGSWVEAVSSLQLGTKKKQVPAWLWLNLGIGLEHLQKLREAIEAYETYLKQFSNNNNPFVLYRLGTVYGQLGEYEQGKTYLKDAISLDPQYAEAYHNLGWILLNINNQDGEIINSHQIRSAYRQAYQLYQKQSKFTLVQSIEEGFQRAGIKLSDII